MLKANTKTKLINFTTQIPTEQQQSPRCSRPSALSPQRCRHNGAPRDLRRPSGKARRPQPSGCALTLHVAPVLAVDAAEHATRQRHTKLQRVGPKSMEQVAHLEDRYGSAPKIPKPLADGVVKRQVQQFVPAVRLLHRLIF